MKIGFSSNCQKKLVAIKHKNQVLFGLISKQLLCFQQQPNHPSLRLHKLKGNMDDVWSISVSKSIRMVFYYRQSHGEKRAVFFAVGTHKEVYK